MIWKRSAFGVASLLVVVTTTGCGTAQFYAHKLGNVFSKKSKTDDKQPQEMLLGVIEMVNPEQRFVLIRTDSNVNVPAGTVLEARSAGGGETKLIAAPEKKMNFVSADIAEGYPQPGETVIISAAQQPQASPAPPAAANAEAGAKALPQPATQAPPGEPVPGVPPVNR